MAKVVACTGPGCRTFLCPALDSKLARLLEVSMSGTFGVHQDADDFSLSAVELVPLCQAPQEAAGVVSDAAVVYSSHW